MAKFAIVRSLECRVPGGPMPHLIALNPIDREADHALDPGLDHNAAIGGGSDLCGDAAVGFHDLALYDDRVRAGGGVCRGQDLRRWDDWSPWAKLDPHAVAEFSGADKGEGARFRWAGNNKVGVGMMTIIESRPHERVRIQLDFLKPMRATNEALFTFQPDGAGTRVTWQMTGQNSFTGRLACTFMNMDKMVGGEFEKGLAAMKAKVEGTA